MYMTEIREFRVTHQRNWYLSCTLKEVCEAEKALLARWENYLMGKLKRVKQPGQFRKTAKSQHVQGGAG